MSSVSDVWTLGEGLFILACTIMETDIIAVGLLTVETGKEGADYRISHCVFDSSLSSSCIYIRASEYLS